MFVHTIIIYFMRDTKERQSKLRPPEVFHLSEEMKLMRK